MNDENWVPTENIEDDAIFWRGTKIKVNTGWSSPTYYEYILAEIYGNHEYFQITCISPHKAGAILAIIKLDLPNQYVLGKELKHILIGGEDTFIKIQLAE